MPQYPFDLLSDAKEGFRIKGLGWDSLKICHRVLLVPYYRSSRIEILCENTMMIVSGETERTVDDDGSCISDNSQGHVNHLEIPR
jgi:hypothetical protein